MKKIYLKIKYLKNKPIKAYILDLSRCGMGLATIKKLEKGLSIALTPEVKFLPKLKARVVYASKLPRKEYNYRTGVEFIDLNQKQKNCLDKFIKQVMQGKKNGNSKYA